MYADSVLVATLTHGEAWQVELTNNSLLVPTPGVREEFAMRIRISIVDLSWYRISNTYSDNQWNTIGIVSWSQDSAIR